jgi:hypothetical protein
LVSSTTVGSLKKILSGFNELRIADFQRNYTWQAENVKQLWDDIRIATEERTDHFISALVYEQSEYEVDGDKVQVAEIVDGQQRLTTLFLIAARLRDEVERLDPNMEVLEKGKSLGLRTELERFIGHAAGSAEFKPNPLVVGIWNEAVKRPIYSYGSVQQAKDDFEGRSIRKRVPASGAAQTIDIRNAYFQIKSIVRAYTNCPDPSNQSDLERAKTEIHQVFKTLSERLKTLAIVTNSSSESLNIFLTLNDRGTELGVFDLVRGHILRATTLGKSESEKTTAFAQAMNEWEDMFLHVDSSKELDQFVRYWLHLRPEVVVAGKNPKRFTEKKVPGFVEELIGKGISAKADVASQIWNSFKVGIELHEQIMKPKVGHRISVKSFYYLRALREMGSSYRIYAYRLMDPDIALDKSKIEKGLEQLVRYYTRHFVCGGNAQEAETALQSAALKLSRTNFNASLKDLTSLADATPMPSIQLIMEAGEDMKRAFLFICESSATANVQPIQEFDVEHIAPATPNAHWKKVIASPEYKKIVSEIGNLVLLDPGVNKSIKQKAFTDKVVEYRKSNVETARNVARDYKTWDSVSIGQRTSTICLELLSFLK